MLFGVWHFDTACQYHSPTNITLFGVWHFDSACQYHSPTNITLFGVWRFDSACRYHSPTNITLFGVWHFDSACRYHLPTNTTLFGVWHFDTACQYHSPTNIALYFWTGKISCCFLHDSVSFSQNHSIIIICTYLVVIIHSTFLQTSCRTIYSNFVTAVACVFTSFFKDSSFCCALSHTHIPIPNADCFICIVTKVCPSFWSSFIKLLIAHLLIVMILIAVFLLSVCYRLPKETHLCCGNVTIIFPTRYHQYHEQYHHNNKLLQYAVHFLVRYIYRAPKNFQQLYIRVTKILSDILIQFIVLSDDCDDW
jgi:hypothetical protein